MIRGDLILLLRTLLFMLGCVVGYLLIWVALFAAFTLGKAGL